MNFEKVMPKRECGPCTLCCKVLEVKELAKAKDHWCQHAKPGKGCGIYAERPTTCQEFLCLWLSGHFGAGQLEFRPDRLHAVVTLTLDRQNWVIHEDPGYRGVARTHLKTIMERFTADGHHYVVVVCGAERVFFGSSEKFKELQARREPLVEAP